MFVVVMSARWEHLVMSMSDLSGPGASLDTLHQWNKIPDNVILVVTSLCHS